MSKNLSKVGFYKKGKYCFVDNNCVLESPVDLTASEDESPSNKIYLNSTFFRLFSGVRKKYLVLKVEEFKRKISLETFWKISYYKSMVFLPKQNYTNWADTDTEVKDLDIENSVSFQFSKIELHDVFKKLAIFFKLEKFLYEDLFLSVETFNNSLSFVAKASTGIFKEKFVDRVVPNDWKNKKFVVNFSKLYKFVSITDSGGDVNIIFSERWFYVEDVKTKVKFSVPYEENEKAGLSEQTK
jgi:hypothetical protein